MIERRSGRLPLWVKGRLTAIQAPCVDAARTMPPKQVETSNTGMVSVSLIGGMIDLPLPRYLRRIPAPMIDALATNTVAAAMVTANRRMITSQHLIRFQNMSELPSGIDVNQIMSGTRHLRNCHRYQSHRRNSERPIRNSVGRTPRPKTFGRRIGAWPRSSVWTDDRTSGECWLI